MRNLIRANFTRMICDKVFWSMTIALLVLGLIVLNVLKNTQENNATVSLESVILSVFLMIGVVLSIFTSLFIGTEYSDATLRNKLSVGAKRTHIYMSNFITCALSGIIIEVIWTVAVTIFGLVLLGTVVTPIATILLWAAIGILLTLSIAAIFTLIAMLITSKAFSAIICLSISIVLLMVSTNLFTSLQEPEFFDGMVASTTGVAETADDMQNQHSMQYVENIPNPKYISKEQRPFFQGVVDILPTGQALQLMSQTVPQPWLLMLYSTAIIVILNGVGIFIFSKKDLK